MRLTVVPKPELTRDQTLYLDNRLAAPEHAYDHGTKSFWHIYLVGLYAFIDQRSQSPIAIASATGPSIAVVPGWWIDSLFRGQGYGNEVVDLLATHLKREGYTGVGQIVIDTYAGAYLEQSSKLAKRFRRHFSGGVDWPKV